MNRTLELLRAVLGRCVNEWEWLDRAPHVRMLKEPTRRIRFLHPRKRSSFWPSYRRIYRGKPMTQVSTKAWYGALKRAGIEKFR